MTPALRLLLRCALIFTTATTFAGEGYPLMPQIAPIGERIAKYQDIPESALGPAVDPGKGYRLQDLGDGLYMVTDNIYQSMFLVYDRGVVVVDAPPNYAKRIPQAIAEVTKNAITHVIYSHSHIDHIGGVTALGGDPAIIAQEETARLLKRAADPNRPAPTITFKDSYALNVGGKRARTRLPRRCARTRQHLHQRAGAESAHGRRHHLPGLDAMAKVRRRARRARSLRTGRADPKIAMGHVGRRPRRPHRHSRRRGSAIRIQSGHQGGSREGAGDDQARRNAQSRRWRQSLGWL